MRHFLSCLLLGLLLIAQGAAQAPPSATPPPPAPPLDPGDASVTTVLLLGSATQYMESAGLTDVIMVAFINRSAGSVTLVSLPRDLYVEVPGHGAWKLNQAYYLGETRDDDRSGIDLLKATLLHNFGIPIDHYARVNFTGFARMIDALGGVRIAVDCTIEDWRLIEPELDPQVEENWALFTLRTGLYRMDGDTALWYVRSRRTSSDLDRNRRQMDVLRAIWRGAREQGLAEHLPSLWAAITPYLDTDLALTDLLALLPVAVEITPATLEQVTLRQGREIRNGLNEKGQFVFERDDAAIRDLLESAMRPPTAYQIGQHAPTVAITNATGYAGLAEVAAQRLEWEGFDATVIQPASVTPRDYNHIIDHVGADKDSPLADLQRVLRVTDEGVSVQPDPTRAYDYEVFIGATYAFTSCTRNVIQPTPAPAAEPGG
jgi:polyisoprenyl-teichoic acid--peptidoglycan teichoic acid transferase